MKDVTGWGVGLFRGSDCRAFIRTSHPPTGDRASRPAGKVVKNTNVGTDLQTCPTLATLLGQT